MLFHGQQVRQQLGGVELVGEAVPHRHAGVLRRVSTTSAVAAVLNAVVHPSEHAGGVLIDSLWPIWLPLGPR